MKRLGPFSPLATAATFSQGSRTLLRQAERSGEIALHVVRGVWLGIVLVAVQDWSGAASGLLIQKSAAIAAVWAVALIALASSRAFTLARYALTILDGWIVVGMLLALYGPLEPARELMRAQGIAPTTEQVATYAPPMLVFLALSGVLRLDPRAAVLSGALAVAGAVIYVVALGVERTGVLLLPLVVLSAVVAANAARVIRYAVLKAQEGAVYQSYVPESLSRDLAEHGALERGGRVEDVTLLVCDIRGFTKLSERLSPAETVAFVNSYLEAVCPPIASSGGVIDKFMGDGVLAFFEGGGNASRALGAARRVAEAAAAIQVRVGVALHSGQVLVGTVGPRTRREYTIISDAVNTLTRLEELNKTYGSTIVVSDTTMARVAETERSGFDGPVNVAVRGRESGLAVWVHGAAVPLGDERDLGDRLRRFVGRDPEQPA